MTTIYVICAAETEGDRCRIAGAQPDFPLTAHGVRQAETLGSFFAGKPVEAIYTSDLRSAAATARLIWDNTAVNAVTDASLRELSLGIWEGSMLGTLAYEEPRKLEALRALDPYWRVPEADSIPAAAGRLKNALLTYASAHADATIAVVTHRYLAGALLDSISDRISNRPSVIPSPCTLAVLHAEDGALTTDVITDGQTLLSSIDPALVPSRTVPDFDTDASCYLLREVEYGDIFAEAVQSVWTESGESRPFDVETLMSDASRRTTFMGFVEQTPACFLQTGPLPGWITLLVVHPGCRNLGVGTQMIGLAAMNARNAGSETLSILLPPDNPYRDFFIHLGFLSEGSTEEGRELLTKQLT